MRGVMRFEKKKYSKQFHATFLVVFQEINPLTPLGMLYKTEQEQ